jgi:hypothetical protein
MRKTVLALVFCTLALGCTVNMRTDDSVEGSSAQPNLIKEDKVIDQERAISIAKEDAFKVYASLNEFDVGACEMPQTWHIIFELRAPNRLGGGPEYVIDKRTGIILRKRYGQ